MAKLWIVAAALAVPSPLLAQTGPAEQRTANAIARAQRIDPQLGSAVLG